MAEFPLEEAIKGKDVEVIAMPFELRPFPLPTLRPEGDYLQQAWSQSVYPLAAQMGVEIKLPTVSPQPYTHLAFEGFQFASHFYGNGNAYNSRLLKAFFQQDQDIGQIHVLTRLAGEVGLDKLEFRESLETRQFREAHQRALRLAHDLGITAVPAFQIGKHILLGLQSKERLEKAIELAGDDE